MKRRNFVISEFHCTECELIIPLPRIHGRQREKGHVKDIWCPKCQRKMKFREVRYKELYKTMAGDVIEK